MLPFSLCAAFIFWISTTESLPHQGYRLRNGYPHQTMMLSGFYGTPNFPRGSMTALASGDAAAMNSFAANDYLSFLGGENIGQDEEDYAVNQKRPELTAERDDTISEEKPVITPTKRTQVQKHLIDEDDGNNSHATRGNGNPGYNSYFPIIFGGQGSGQSRGNGNDGYGYGGAPIAIANSYSTGKGGIASSHATAYGDPLLSMYLRNINKRKN